MLHGHGDDAYRHGVSVRANFSSNVRPDVDLTDLREHCLRHFDAIRTYPEVAGEELGAQIAAAENVPAGQIVVTAGATAAIYLIAHTYRARRSCVVAPTFAEYGDAAELHEHRVSYIRREDFAAGRIADADLVWLCNPNNPTGETFPREAILATVAQHRRIVFVVDIAYAEFCAEPALRASDVRDYPNLILLQSLTKTHAIPGLRLGFLVAAKERASAITRHMAPWSINTLALEAGRYLLARGAVGAPWRAEYLANARQLAAALAAISGVRVWPSVTGFFVLELTRGTAGALKTHLLHRHGLLIRDASNFRGLDHRHVRISTQTPEQNRWLEAAMIEWMRS